VTPHAGAFDANRQKSDHFTSELTTMPTVPENANEASEYDPTFLHSRREAIIIFGAWLVGLIWAVPYCYLNGYTDRAAAGHFAMTWGIPSWLFWGIFVPWIVADLFATWFCFFYLKDDDLGEAPESAASVSEIKDGMSAERERE